MIYISDSAQKHFIKLLNQQKKGTQIRIFIKNSNSFHKECGICYYFPKSKNIDDTIIKFNSFSIYLNNTIIPFIKETQIDLISNEFSTHLSIKSPYLNTTITNKNKENKSSLEEKIKHILDFQINPQLSLHGGKVSLICITKESVAVLKFYGGCNGCTMASYTIKEGIEKTLKKIFPDLTGVVDITQHKHGDHSYY